MRSHKRRDAVAGELSAIADLSRADLIARWVATHGSRPPKGISRRLLEYSAAYAIQARALGGLKSVLRRKLVSASGDGALRTPIRDSSKKRKALSAGARLVRDWHGRTHTVDIVDGGFRYEGRDYRSLSQIAREITGARWSGPRFFGL